MSTFEIRGNSTLSSHILLTFSHGSQTLHPSSSSGSFLSGACRSDRRSDDEEGAYGQQLRRQGGYAEEDVGRGQIRRTNPFLCNTIQI